MKKKCLNLGAVVLSAALLSGVLSGCASNHPKDPFEPVNRAVFSFNDGLDRAVLKPVARGYRAVTPTFVRGHVSNFFGNLGDAWGTVNAGFQLKPEKFLTGLFRVGINTIFGFGGLIDIASEMRLDKPQEDFGQTLGYWGVGSGPYIVWPVLGPSNVRDSVGTVADAFAHPITYIKDDGTRYGVVVLGAINLRASLIGVDEVANDAALDRYIFFRDAYMQRRQNLIYDGNPPMDPEFEINDEDL